MLNKLKANWGKPGDEFLPPFTLIESVDNLLYRDRMLGDGKMTYDAAEKLVVAFRKINEEIKDA